jgi:hypothetical protein
MSKNGLVENSTRFSINCNRVFQVVPQEFTAFTANPHQNCCTPIDNPCSEATLIWDSLGFLKENQVNKTLQDALEKLDPHCDECRGIAEQYQPDLIPAARTALIDLITQHLK